MHVIPAQSASVKQPQLPLPSHTVVPAPQGFPTFVGVVTSTPPLQPVVTQVLVVGGTLLVSSTRMVCPPFPSHTARWQAPAAAWYAWAVVELPGYGPQTLFVHVRTWQLSAGSVAKHSLSCVHSVQTPASLQKPGRSVLNVEQRASAAKGGKLGVPFVQRGLTQSLVVAGRSALLAMAVSPPSMQT